MEQISIKEEFVKQRLDTIIASLYPEHTRSFVKRLIDDGNILVNNQKQKAGYLVKKNDAICVDFPEIKPDTVNAEDLPLDIVYEDEDLLVINKAKGMTVHPASTCKNGTLVNALLYKIKNLSSVNGEFRPGIVHRLDKDTSGLMLVAKNDFSHNSLAKQISEKSCIREYIALVNGVIQKDEGEIITHIGRDPKDRKRMAVVPVTKGKVAITNFKVEKRYNKYTLVSFRLKTGRTHQIRVHCKYLGYPIVGDLVYSHSKNTLGAVGQLLHSRYIEFTQPKTGKRLSFSAPIPKDFDTILQKLD